MRHLVCRFGPCFVSPLLIPGRTVDGFWIQDRCPVVLQQSSNSRLCLSRCAVCSYGHFFLLKRTFSFSRYALASLPFALDFFPMDFFFFFLSQTGLLNLSRYPLAAFPLFAMIYPRSTIFTYPRCACFIVVPSLLDFNLTLVVVLEFPCVTQQPQLNIGLFIV